ncbi:MAG: homocysteine S-methyltransferase family protein [Candidatus Krumholzibacteriota bacterium]|nr:homocysteine S-methyltransferase family protein [Candidatus Krumholzibacteriota bacterium]
MKEDIRKIIRQRKVLFDGGMGSMLIAAGLGEREIPEQWNFLHPEKVIDIHIAYLAAGADVIQTNSFGATSIKLSASEAGKALDPAEVNEKAAGLAFEALERAKAPDRYVAGDIGPTGEFFAPVGRLTEKRAREAFREQAEALERGGVDLFLIETMYDLREAVEALRAVKEVSKKPVAVEMTFDSKPKGYFTLMGDTPEKAAEILSAEGADLLGANCTLSSDRIIQLAPRFRGLTDMPLLFQPNAGSPAFTHGKAVYRQSPEEFARDIEKLLEAGIDAVGGCCGTTPDFTRELRKLIDGYQQQADDRES